MSRGQKQAQTNLVRISSYFEMLKDKPLNHPEYEIVKSTVALISSKKNFTEKDLVEIAKLQMESLAKNIHLEVDGLILKVV